MSERWDSLYGKSFSYLALVSSLTSLSAQAKARGRSPLRKRVREALSHDSTKQYELMKFADFSLDGFAAVSASGSPPCCQCYELTFTSTSLATSGKKMIVQATNTGGDVSATQFDIAMPGGGFGT